MYACRSAALPEYTWTSSVDATDFLPGWTCERLDKPLPGGSLQAWLQTSKIIRLIESLPIP